MSLILKQRRPIPLLFRLRPGKRFPSSGGSFTRPDSTTCATYIDKDGLPRLALANVLRSRHWVDLDGDGRFETPTILLEPGDINLALRSEGLSVAPWVQGQMTSVTDAALAFGDFGLSKLVPNGTNSNQHTVTQSALSVNATDFFGLRFRFAQAGYTALILRVTGNDGVTNRVKCVIDLLGGTVVTSVDGAGVVTGAKLMPGPLGTWELILWGTIGETTANAKISLELYDTIAHANGLTAWSGDTVKGIYAGMAFLRKGSVGLPPSSYIKTGAGAVTRAADTLYYPIAFVPRPLSAYVELIEAGAAAQSTGIPRVWSLGSDNVAGTPYLNTTNNGGYGARYNDGFNTIQGPSFTGIPNFGDRVEMLIRMNLNSVIEAFGAINLGATVIGSKSGGGFALAPAWSFPRLVLTSPNVSIIKRLAIGDGIISLEDMRTVA